MRENPFRWLALPALLLLLTACKTPAAHDQSAGPVFYPDPPDERRLQLLGRFSSAEDVQPVSRFRKFVAGDEPRRSIGRAHGVAWHDGKLYVCDPGSPHVAVFDLRRKEMRPLDETNPRRFRKPIEIAIAPDGWKYITDTVLRKVVVYGPDDRFRALFGDPEAWRPVGIAVHGDRLYVTDAENHQLVVLDRTDGRELARWGKEGPQDGEFYFPIAVDVGPDGDVYVTDSFHFKIQRLKADGTFVSSHGEAGDIVGTFARPKGVAVDRKGRFFVVDAAFENVQIFDHDGKPLLFFGAPGPDPGNLNLPADVCVSYDAVPEFADRVAPGESLEYVVFVSSQTGPNKVNAYGMLRKE